jgi:flavin reductase (DIM6/NTAB) family NADH-FMN oxidoreductase RutF
MHFNSSQLQSLDRFYRANLINSITGFKSLNLLGTKSKEGISNLALFSQVIHIGADPALMGVLFRPALPGMHSLSNIEETGCFTLNHILPDFVEKAHWTSAKWTESEFAAVGLEEEVINGFFAPFVKESRIKISLAFEEKIPIQQNGTSLVIGSIQDIFLPEEWVGEDGFIDLVKAESVAGIGLDGYYSKGSVQRFTYAKPNQKPEPLKSE